MIADIVLALLGIALVVGVLVVAVVLPIVALVQVRRVRRQLATLQRDVRDLWRESKPAEPRRTIPRQPEVAPEAEPATSADVPKAEPVEAPVELKPWRPVRPVQRETQAAVARRETQEAAADWANLEAWLGVRGLGWAAVVLLIVAAAYFLKLAFERGYIQELGRVTIGVIIGGALCLAGRWCHGRGQPIFCQMLTACGIVILYLSVFASFAEVFNYNLLPRDRAAVFLVVIVAEAFALALLYESPAIAIMAVGGGLLTPVLLYSGRDQHVELFIYLAVLNVGVTAFSLLRRWWGITSLALVGTHILYWSQYFQWGPGAFNSCVIFLAVIFVVYLGQLAILHIVLKKRANIEDLIRLLVLAILTSAAGYQLLDERYHAWMGSIALGMAILFALLTFAVSRFQTADEQLLAVLLALSMAFVAVVFPLQTEAAWIAVGWAAQGLVLVWFGVRIRSLPLCVMGAVFLAGATGRLLLIDTVLNQPLHDGPFVPVFNRFGLPGVMVAGCVIAAALLLRRTGPKLGSPDFLLMRLLGLAGVVTLWIVASIETYDFFVVRGDLYSPGVQARLTDAERNLRTADLIALFETRAEDLRLTAQMALSALWAVFALALLAAGLRLPNRPLRWMALTLFAVTLGKVMLVDTNRLSGFYRVGALVALSLMMAAGAWAYQKLRRVLGS